MATPTLAEKPVLPPNIHRYGLTGDAIMFEVLDDVLTKGECCALIDRMSPALQSVSNALTRLHPLGDERTSKTEYDLSILENQQFTNMLWQRLLDSEAFASIYMYEIVRSTQLNVLVGIVNEKNVACPLVWPLAFACFATKATTDLTHIMTALSRTKNLVLRRHFSLYSQNGRAGSESLITVLIYLNDGDGVEFSGGETLFLNVEHPTREDGVAVVPKTGRVVLFEHCLYHAGAPLELMEAASGTKGCKYIIRTDILFRIHEQNYDKY